MLLSDNSAPLPAVAIADLPPPASWPQFPGQAGLPASFNLCEYLLGAAALARHGARCAIIGPDETLRYTELAARVARIAAALAQQQVRAGSRVLLYAANSPMLAATWLACWYLGAQVVPCGPQLRRQELARLLARFGPGELTLLLAAPAQLAELQAARQASAAVAPLCVLPDSAASSQPDDLWAMAQAATQIPPAHLDSPDALCLLAQTSGSSGQPKLCAHSARALVAICRHFPALLAAPVRDPRHVVFFFPTDVSPAGAVT